MCSPLVHDAPGLLFKHHRATARYIGVGPPMESNRQHVSAYTHTIDLLLYYFTRMYGRLPAVSKGGMERYVP